MTLNTEVVGEGISDEKMPALRELELIITILANHPEFVKIVGKVADALGNDSDALGYAHIFEIEHTGTNRVVPVEISVIVGTPNDEDPDMIIETDE